MKRLAAALLAFCCWAAPQADPVAVDTQHPRLFLNAARLLKRERDRSSERWRALGAMVSGDLAEPGFAQALYYQVSGDAVVVRRAAAWALGTGSDVRQLALVFDWRQDLLTAPQRTALPLFEMLRAVRDAAGIDLRERCPHSFVNLPAERLMSYYPAAYRTPPNSFRAGAERAAGAPDPKLAVRSRAADLAMVSFDPDAPESQALQGWLMHDPFAMRDALGAPYEFLWANPYQPGLSYYHLPLAYYDAVFGKVFVRSSWDDSATWFGYWDGAAQKFADGRALALDPGTAAPERFDAAVVMFSRDFRVKIGKEQRLFVVGLEPHRAYRVETEGAKPFDTPADNGGVLELHPPLDRDVRVSIQ